MKKFYYLLLLSITLSSCQGSYSFTGASVGSDTKTFYVEEFLNRAAIVQPILSSELTNELIKKVNSSTSLVFNEDNADLVFKGTITAYTISPTAIQTDDRAAKNRLSITVRVSYNNKKDKKMSFDQSFTRFKDYDSGLSLSEVEEALIKQINEEIVEDIFNKALVNW